MIKVDILDDGNIVAYDNTIADSVMFEKISFSFPDTWNGYTKTAVFRNSETTISVVLNNDSDLCTGENECYVPYEVIKAPQFTVSVFGVFGDSRATTPQVKITVIKSGYGEGDTPNEPTPTEYEQLIGLVNSTKEIAQSVRNDADNGVFNGEKGEKGDTGEAGAYYGTEAPQTAEYPIWINPEGEGYDIDRNYNPQSDNPQSGKAVAEGLADLSTQIEGEISSVSADIEQVQTDISTINTTLAGLLDVFYPIGSIYQSTSETSPATLFGGTWEQIKDVFLLSAGDTYSAESTGGEAKHTLTVDEMPSHSHNSYISAESGNAYGLTSGGGWTGSVLVGWGTDERENAVKSTGGSQPHNNMPPYLTVYMWKRTA